MWQKIKDACFHSVTIAWGYTKVGAGGVLMALQTNPDFKSKFDSLGLPSWIGLVLITIGIITIACRARTLK
jgi:hypothetical protein